MGDLISRQAAIEEIARRDTTDGTVKVFSGKEVISILKEMPSAQPVIRCKDCKYHGYNECFHKLGLMTAFDNNFCSYAERKEQDDG